MTRANERDESSPSSWAATPETCGAAMLVPLMDLMTVLLEPTHAAGMYRPGAWAHTWRGLCAASPAELRTRGQGEGGGQASARAGGRPLAGRHAHARVGRGQGCGRVRNGAAGEEDLHVDASAEVGERGQRALLSGGANEQLVGGGNWIVVRPTRVRGRVSRGGHDQHLRFVKVRCV